MRVLFVGSFLSRLSGTMGVTETIAGLLDRSHNISVKLVSKRQNRYLRLLDIILEVGLGRYDILHMDVFSGKAFYNNVIASIIGRMRGKKVLMNLHGGRLAEYAERRRRLVFSVLKRADRIITPAMFLRNYFEQRGMVVEYLPNPINLEKFPFRPPSVAAPEFQILWVRAFSKIYNPEIAVWVLKEVLGEIPSAKLTMIGPDKGELTRVKEMVSDLALDERVEIVGPIANDQLYKYYHSHQVYLNTTSFESFGVSVMEAASCGLPIVSTKVGELPYLWKDQEEILMVNGLSYTSLAREVVRIAKDKVLASSLSMKARRKSEEFSWPLIRPKWLALLSVSNEQVF